MGKGGTLQPKTTSATLIGHTKRLMDRAREAELKAWELHIEKNMSAPQIAKEMGVARGTAWRYLTKARQRSIENHRGGIQALAERHVAELQEEMARCLGEAELATDAREYATWLAGYLQALDRLAKITGLYKPERIQVSGHMTMAEHAAAMMMAPPDQRGQKWAEVPPEKQLEYLAKARALEEGGE